MIFSANGGNLDPRYWALPSISVLFFPSLLIFTTLLLIINIFISRISMIINIICLLICSNAILYYCPFNFDRKTNNNDCFSLMTYNVFMFKDFNSKGVTPSDNPTLKFILHYGPDIAALQECYPLNLKYGGTKLSTSLTDSIHKKYPYKDFTAEGQALFSKFPFKVIKHKYLSERSFRIQPYEIYIGKDTLSLINVHLQSIGLSTSDKELYMQITEGQTEKNGLKSELNEIREDLLNKLSLAFKAHAEQINKIYEIASELKEPIIICGDFNDVILSYPCRFLLKHGFKDAYRESALGPSITYHDNRFYFRIDQIFYKGNIQAIYTRKENISSSDHYPLIADFKFK